MHLHLPSPLSLALRYPSLIHAVLIACTLPSLAVAAAVEEATDMALSSEARSKQVAVSYTLQPEKLRETSRPVQKSKLFRLLATGSAQARIVNVDGEVVRSSAPRASIQTLHISPDEGWFLVEVGNSGYSVVSAGSLVDIARPPTHPEAPEDATDFEWKILDNNHLIGQADLPSLDTEGLTAAEVESLPPRDTLIYLYTISSNTMTPIQVDDTLSRPFHITGVTDGQVELLHYVTSEIFGARIVPVPAH